MCDVITHSVTDDLQVETLQFLTHLFVAVAIPTVKVRRPEKLPVESRRWFQFSRPSTGTGSPASDTRTTHLYSPVQSPLSSEVSWGPVWSRVDMNSSWLNGRIRGGVWNVTTNVRRHLLTDNIINYDPLPVYLPGCHRSLQRHQTRHVSLLKDKTQGYCDDRSRVPALWLDVYIFQSIITIYLSHIQEIPVCLINLNKEQLPLFLTLNKWFDWQV